MSGVVQYAPGLLRAERLTLAVLLCGVASLALSDFVSPLYWGLSVVAALCCFWRGPTFQLTDSVLFELPLAAMQWFLWRAAACLYGLNWPGGDLPVTPPGQDLRWMPVMIGVAALLFVVLPRFEFHTLLRAQQPRMHSSGFSDQVQLGDFARQLDEHVVMRVESAEAGENRLAFRRRIKGRYWRGVALSYFTGRGWRRLPGRYVRQLSARSDLLFSTSVGIGTAVYREASDHPYVHLPDGVVSVRRMPEPGRIDTVGALAFKAAPGRRLKRWMQRIRLTRFCSAGGATANCLRHRLHWRRAIWVLPHASSTAITAATGTRLAAFC